MSRAGNFCIASASAAVFRGGRNFIPRCSPAFTFPISQVEGISERRGTPGNAGDTAGRTLKSEQEVPVHRARNQKSSITAACLPSFAPNEKFAAENLRKDVRRQNAQP